MMEFLDRFDALPQNQFVAYLVLVGFIIVLAGELLSLVPEEKRWA